jgi:hypothetical protein
VANENNFTQINDLRQEFLIYWLFVKCDSSYNQSETVIITDLQVDGLKPNFTAEQFIDLVSFINVCDLFPVTTRLINFSILGSPVTECIVDYVRSVVEVSLPDTISRQIYEHIDHYFSSQRVIDFSFLIQLYKELTS